MVESLTSTGILGEVLAVVSERELHGPRQENKVAIVQTYDRAGQPATIGYYQVPEEIEGLVCIRPSNSQELMSQGFMYTLTPTNLNGNKPE